MSTTESFTTRGAGRWRGRRRHARHHDGRFRETAGPTIASTSARVTVGCGGAEGALVSGGAAASGGQVTTTDFSKTGSGGTHLIGTFPGGPDGTPLGDGATTAADWTAVVRAGGSPSPATFSDVWALCLDVRDGDSR